MKKILMLLGLRAISKMMTSKRKPSMMKRVSDWLHPTGKRRGVLNWHH